VFGERVLNKSTREVPWYGGLISYLVPQIGEFRDTKIVLMSLFQPLFEEHISYVEDLAESICLPEAFAYLAYGYMAENAGLGVITFDS
jgi:hypothetical protein